MSQNTKDAIIGVLFVIIIVFGSLGFVGWFGFQSGYEVGQKDAANGKYHWRLVEQNGERVFRYHDTPATRPNQ